MKKTLILVCVGTILLFSSCLTQKPDIPMPGGQSTVPVRYITVNNMEDLDNERYAIIGEVSGYGEVNAYNPEDGDTHKYGRFLDWEEQVLSDNVTMAGLDPYDVSLGNAIYDLYENMKNAGGHFVIFPSYAVEFTDEGQIRTIVSALAVKVLSDIVE